MSNNSKDKQFEKNEFVEELMYENMELMKENIKLIYEIKRLMTKIKALETLSNGLKKDYLIREHNGIESIPMKKERDIYKN